MNHALFIASAACLLAAMARLARALPGQNVAYIVVVLVLVEVAMENWTHATDMLTGAAFWPAAILWFRDGTQLLLKRWRHNPNYGLFLLGLPSLAAAGVQIIFTPGILAAGRFCLTAVCLAFLMPWFLQKRVTASEESKR
jgi:hypothetical protein